MAEARQIREPARQLLQRPALTGVLAEHLGRAAYSAAGRHRDVREAHIGAGGRAELLGQNLGGQPRANAGRVQHADRAVRLAGQRCGRLARLLAASVREPEVALVAARLAVAQETQFAHGPHP